jgi:hypothetical protein
MFLQSLKDPSLSANVTSVRGQIQIFMEQNDAFEDSDIILPTNLAIDGITNTLTAFPAPMESSISFATANRYSINDSSDDESIDFQGFSVNATTSSRSNDRSTRGSFHKPKANRKEDKKDTAKEVVCRGCHKKGHKEVDCRELAKWIIISGAVKKLKEGTRKHVLDNYHRHYSSDPPSKQISKSCTDQLLAFCESRHMTPSQVVNHYNWDGYINDGEEDGFEMATEGEDESN